MYRIITLALALLLLLPVYLPESVVNSLPVSEELKTSINSKDLRYGLDLSGGRQLDFEVDLTRVREQIASGATITEDEVVQGVITTLRRRIDPDSSREINIYRSDFGDEVHVFVELTADLDNEETLALLQKYIDLQFREIVPNTDERASSVVSDAYTDFKRGLSVSQDRDATITDWNNQTLPTGILIATTSTTDETATTWSSTREESEYISQPVLSEDNLTAVSYALGDSDTLYKIDYTLDDVVWVSTGLDGQHFTRAIVEQDQLTGMSQVAVQFDSKGSEMFTSLTERLVGQPLGIFVGGEFVSAPEIKGRIPGGAAAITVGVRDPILARKEAAKLANDLNAGAIDAPIMLVGERRVAPDVGAEALTTSAWAGLFGLLLVSLYIIYVYRIMGVFAVIALMIYAYLFVGIIQLLPFGFLPPLVLTLSGVAGVILSLGFAVDANVLIFERIREELKSGKTYATATSLGFTRAWSAIRDANGTTLMICLILFFLGTQEIAKFSLMLAIGILLSMFTAITVTRILLSTLEGKSITHNHSALIGLND